jgi:hypothetical protein
LSSSFLGRFIPEEGIPYLLYRRLGGLQNQPGLYGEVKNAMLLPGIELGRLSSSSLLYGLIN